MALKGAYTNELGKKWAAKVAEADAYIMVTPEYNHGYPAVLKNAIDWVFYEWQGKPVGFVSYGTVSGSRAVEQLRQVVIELSMHPIRNAIHVPVDIFIAALTGKGPADNNELFKPMREGAGGDRVKTFFDELLPLAKTLKDARK
jgi:NAD(P)H-dependent FMN reductase